jgi:Papain family cysteine protease
VESHKLELLNSTQFLRVPSLRLKQLLNYQPIGIALNTPPCFDQYKSGILSPKDCDCTAQSEAEIWVDHLFTLVGYASDKSVQGCSGYWIVKGSFGTQWGENGYVRLCISSNADDVIGMCNILTYPHLPDIGILPEKLPEDIVEVDS